MLRSKKSRNYNLSLYAREFTDEGIARALLKIKSDRNLQMHNVHAFFCNEPVNQNAEEDKKSGNLQKTPGLLAEVCLLVVNKQSLAKGRLRKHQMILCHRLQRRREAITEAYYRLLKKQNHVDWPIQQNHQEVSAPVSPAAVLYAPSQINRNAAAYNAAFNNLFSDQVEMPTNIRVSNYIRCMAIGVDSLATLGKKEEADDNIINAFSYIMCNYAGNSTKRSIMYIDAILTWNILDDDKLEPRPLSIGKLDLINARVLLLPYNRNKNHWVLFVVYVQHNLMCYFDSLSYSRASPNSKWFHRVYTFLRCFMNDLAGWKEWTVYVPTDTPKQLTNSEFANDCGVHVCSWIYAIRKKNVEQFTAVDMNNARRCIASVLYNHIYEKDNYVCTTFYQGTKRALTLNKNLNYGTVNISNKIPLGYTSTFELVQNFY